MKHGHLMTAAVLAGMMLVGCDSKSQTKTAAEPTHDAPAGVSGQTPTPPATDANTAVQNVGDRMKAMGQNAKDAAQNAGTAISSETQKLRAKASATTMPSNP